MLVDIEKEREQEENERKKAYLRRYLNAKRKQELIETEIDELRIKQMTPSGLKQDGMPRGSNTEGICQNMRHSWMNWTKS